MIYIFNRALNALLMHILSVYKNALHNDDLKVD